MIYADSRYIDGTLAKVYRSFSDTYEQTVYRTWPSYAIDFFYYTVTEIDRIEELAATFLGSPDLWWRIMDINSNVLNPFEIPAGTQLRIPSE
jgi:hypothetical protein